jgi:3-hydroxymyristoyl/3-hydroxydecanoyl-(acyl carrier protein) dehydratase
MSPDLDAFRDHFPQHPILPGVVQVDWAVQLANQHLGLGLISAQDFQIKFRSIIRPGMIISISLRHDKASHRLSFDYRRQNEIMSSGVIKLGAA